jgi:Tol biopolymer transport system component
MAWQPVWQGLLAVSRGFTDETGSLALYDVDLQEERVELMRPECVNIMEWSPNGRLLMVLRQSPGKIDIFTGSDIHETPTSIGDRTCPLDHGKWSPDGSNLANLRRTNTVDIVVHVLIPHSL